MSEPEPIGIYAVYEEEDGKIVYFTAQVDYWPERALFNAIHLQDTSESVLTVDGNTINLLVTNGMAVYEVESWEGDTVIARRMYCEWRLPE